MTPVLPVDPAEEEEDTRATLHLVSDALTFKARLLVDPAYGEPVVQIDIGLNDTYELVDLIIPATKARSLVAALEALDATWVEMLEPEDATSADYYHRGVVDLAKALTIALHRHRAMVVEMSALAPVAALVAQQHSAALMAALPHQIQRIVDAHDADLPPAPPNARIPHID